MEDEWYDDLVMAPPSPLFRIEDYESPEHLALIAHYRRAVIAWYVKTFKLGRNHPCMCGSGRKFKKCHGGGDT